MNKFSWAARWRGWPMLAGLIVAIAAGRASAAMLTGIGGAPSDPVFLGPAVINFDSTPVGSYGALSIGNVKFVGVDGPFIINPIYLGQYNTSGVNSMQTGSAVNPINPLLPSVIEFNFGIPVSAFAFNFGAADNTWRMDAYNTANVLIESDLIPILPPSSNNGDYFGIANTGIKRAVITDLKDNFANGDYILIDDFTTSFENAPEPSSAAVLMSVGAASVMLRRRRCIAL